MNKLWVACLGAWIMLCLSAPVALAQAEVGTVPFCDELSAEVCAALDGTTQMMGGLTSGSTENQVEVFLTGGPLGEQRLSLQLSSAQQFVMTPATAARLRALQALTPEELAASPDMATEAMLLPLSMDFSQTMTMAFSPELLSLLTAQLGVSVPATLTFQTRLIDQVAYIRLADYAVFGTQPEWVPEWLGIELAPFITTTMASEVTSPDFDIRDAQDALVAPGTMMATSIIYHVRPEQLPAYADFMQIAEVGTAELDGRAVKAYRVTWDIPRYVGGPLFAQQIGLAAESGQPTPASLVLGMASSILLHGLQAEVTQVVGVGDNYLYQMESRVTWDLSIAGGPLLTASPTLGVTARTVNSDLNDVAAIPVPEGAVVPPLNVLMQTFRLLNR